ncbi:response regulator transcription factor [Streptomyces sp. ISL-10]|uniref:response regulator transcription factor n=1 Tax=Streptomyces sp. ISL-10 TaxID=2819172 RepID=UPI001BE52311|nr:response regulator transcription factor [Streptomyces sp. ISL-10]MBT2365860.1 response regulator transcription factor [Streptomyces sp. ISL-10]
MAVIKVLLVDSEQIVLEGLRKLLDSFGEFSVVSTALDGASAIRALRAHRPHIVVTGLSIAGAGGIHAARLIRKDSEHVRIVILSSNQQPVFMREAFVAGANAYLSRRISGEELRQTLLAVHRDGAALSGAAAGLILQIASGRSPEDDCPLSHLTGRERQILSLVADDHDTGHIAKHLGISPKTVRNYLSRIYAKLGTPNRVQTTLYAKRFMGRSWQPDGVPVEP